MSLDISPAPIRMTPPRVSGVVVPPQHSGQQHRQVSSPRFGNGLMNGADRFVSWFVRNLYDRGEGFRYLVEQTLGYTAPRTIQQLNRTRSITGKGNEMAAQEMLIRDLAADFTDTILPGLIATFGVGWVMDRMGKTLLQRNMGHDALAFYQHMARGAKGAAVSQAEFYQGIETRLTDFAKASKATPAKALNLKALINEMRSSKHIEDVEKTIATRLGLSHYDVKLAYGNKKHLELPLRDLVKDLWHIRQGVKTSNVGNAWGKEALAMVQKTAGKMKWQMLGNVAALVASISIPFVVRLITKRVYGKDAFPGTKELEEHFKTPEAKKAQDSKRFVWFPYLQETLKNGNWTPLAITAGFFAVLGGVVLRRFHLAKGSIFRFKDWVKVYEFQRHFPFTTVTQMELTYGLLCGMRLAASRDQAEFRETAIRDCLLGWPTLTYFFPMFRKFLSQQFNQRFLTKKFRTPNLLIKPNGEVRGSHEMTPELFKTMGLGAKASTAVQSAKKYQSWITFISALTSWVMLAFAEPQLGIWLTNSLELRRLKGLSQQKGQEASTATSQSQENQEPLEGSKPSHASQRWATESLAELDHHQPAVMSMPAITPLQSAYEANTNGYSIYPAGNWASAWNGWQPIPYTPAAYSQASYPHYAS